MAGMLSKAKMPWISHGSKEQIEQSEGEGESLTTVLTTEGDRSALTLLIADCSEAMRQSIVDIFDAKQTGKKEDIVADPEGDQAVLRTREGPDSAEQEKLNKELEQREKELSSAKFQELREAALKDFDEWRDSVIQRVGETVNSREEAVEHKHKAHQQKPRQEEPAVRAAPPMKFPDVKQYDEGIDQVIRRLYLPIENPLKKLPEEKRALILHSLLLLLLSLEHYRAYSRVLLLRLSTSLDLSISFLGQTESKVARTLLTAVENMKADDETKQKAEENKGMRRWKVGLATVAGAALIGVTGGLAAPLLAAGVGSVMGGLGLGATAAAGYLGTLAGSSVLVGGLFGAYGGRMTGKMMDQYARDVEDFAFVPIRSAHTPRKIEKEYRRLRVGIGISGWLTHKDEVDHPWKVVGTEMESFALRWELQALMKLGNSMTTMLKSAVWTVAKKEIIQRTVFAALTAGLWPLALVKASRIIDNPWSVASHRAQKAGEVLADALINKAQGERPVTLVGYSLGAKVIFACLQQLAKRKAFGLVESVILMGAPTPSTPADWRMLRSVVSGRVVNVFSTNDYILGFLYRSSSIQYGVAGLQAVENVKGVENVDFSELVTGHLSYRFLTGNILKQVGFEDVDYEEAEQEERERKEEEAKEEHERREDEKKVVQDPNGNMETVDVSDQHVEELEKEVERKNRQSYASWAQEKMNSAGTGAAVAYEKAKAQWSSRKPDKNGKTAANSAKEAEERRD